MMKYQEYPTILGNIKYAPHFCDDCKSILELNKM